MKKVKSIACVCGNTQDPKGLCDGSHAVVHTDNNK